MNIDYAVISSDDSHYLDFYPIVSSAWNKLGIQTFMIHITKENSEIQKNDHGLYVKLKASSDYPTSWQSQLCRLYSYALLKHKNKNLLISDIDMLPINGNYFTSVAKEIDESSIVSYSGQPYEDVPYFPMCYILGNSTLMNEKFSLEKDFDSFLLRLNNLYGTKWNTDENFLYDSLHGAPNLISRNDRKRHQRIDRSSWNYDIDLLNKGYYIDSHLPRPYSQYKSQIEDLIKSIL
jgi:hypothetical protein